MQFSLKWMMVALAFVGFGCVALYNANQAWAEATMGLTTFVLLAAILGSIYLRPRAFYIGMCVFGWGYLLLTYAPMRVNPPAFADTLLEFTYKTMQREPDANQQNSETKHYVQHLVLNYQIGAPPQPPASVPDRGQFRAVGHSLFALVFAMIGGVVARCFSRTKRE